MFGDNPLTHQLNRWLREVFYWENLKERRSSSWGPGAQNFMSCDEVSNEHFIPWRSWSKGMVWEADGNGGPTIGPVHGEIPPTWYAYESCWVILKRLALVRLVHFLGVVVSYLMTHQKASLPNQRLESGTWDVSPFWKTMVPTASCLGSWSSKLYITPMFFCFERSPQKSKWYGCYFRHPAITSRGWCFIHVYPMIYRFFSHPRWWSPDFNHQQFFVVFPFRGWGPGAPRNLVGFGIGFISGNLRKL